MKTTSKHGQRAPNQRLLSVPLEADLLEEIKRLARADGRKTAAFVRFHLEQIVKDRSANKAEIVSSLDELEKIRADVTREVLKALGARKRA